MFNSDYHDSIDEFWKDFAGKMDKKAFIQYMDDYCARVPHGFIAIVNDPNCPIEEKFYYGLAEEVPVGLETIVGCREFWKGAEKQLEEIRDGTIAMRIEKIKELSKPNERLRREKAQKEEKDRGNESTSFRPLGKR